MEKPASIKIWVADVIVRQREVECPTVCPHCQADLTTSGADGELKLVIDGLDETTEHGAIVVDDDRDQPDLENFESEGSDVVAYMNVRCDSCNKSVLAEPGTLRNHLPSGLVIT